jgi:D-alanine-D-alanine ligase
MKRVCAAWGIGFPDYVMARTEEDVTRAADTLRYPLIVKHPSSYSSIDLTPHSRVETTFALRYRARPFMKKYGGVLIEEFIDGREFTVLVAENPDDPTDPVTYVPVEFVFPEGESFKHSDLKWFDYHNMEEVPVRDEELSARLRDVSARFFMGMRGASFGRCDIRMDGDGNLYILEINPNCGIYYAPSDPGSADLSLLNDPAGHQGFTDLLIRAGLARHARKQRGWETRPIPGNGFSVFANRALEPGETIMVLEGRPHTLVTRGFIEEGLGKREEECIRRQTWPITEDLWVTWPEDPEDWKPVRHSCDPNAWLEGLNLVARKAISPGEEIRVDFATYGTNVLGAFDCDCGAVECRGRIQEDDHLQSFMTRYGDHVSEFVQTQRARRKSGG